MYKINPAYPTVQHERAALKIVDYFSHQLDVSAVLLTCSCARGKAAKDSCLDIAILLSPNLSEDKRDIIEQEWNQYHTKEILFRELEKMGKYSHVDLEFRTGCFKIPYHGWTSGPDELELEIGNLLVYSVLLWGNGDYLEHLKSQWLPYYSEEMRIERLTMVKKYLFNNLDHITRFVERELYFQSFRRLYNAFGEFLQALFISRKIYPIAYDKWVREQIVEILKLPELYPQLPRLLEIGKFESYEIMEKSKQLQELAYKYIP